MVDSATHATRSQIEDMRHRRIGDQPNRVLGAYGSFVSHKDQSSQLQMSNSTVPNAFEMDGVAASLPHVGQPFSDEKSAAYVQDAANLMATNIMYQVQPSVQFQHTYYPQYDPAAVRAHQQFTASVYEAGRTNYWPSERHQPMYAQRLRTLQHPFMDSRLNSNVAFGFHAPMQAMVARRASAPAPLPFLPRGPPRKPKQSGYALWVGNLPPAATVTDLKDHFSRDAMRDIESLFLISKSNCAFVNYRTEAACVSAMYRFHDSRFYGVRLVCRLRRGTSSRSSSSSSTLHQSAPSGDNSSALVFNKEPTSPIIVGGSQLSVATQDTETRPANEDDNPRKIPEKFFIVKSLTVQDLEASVRNGVWAAQSHNEAAMNEAYHQAASVYLIFSANKSGEYFGYARMASPVSDELTNMSKATSPDPYPSSGSPQLILTPATDTAPRGHIVDDSARGTIFWEADHSDDERVQSPEKDNETAVDEQWSRQFRIQWISTSKLPFYRTRGLRNPWNANREVKIARDGTELEPSIGRRLIEMFHRQLSFHDAEGQPAMSYR